MFLEPCITMSVNEWIGTVTPASPTSQRGKSCCIVNLPEGKQGTHCIPCTSHSRPFTNSILKMNRNFLECAHTSSSRPKVPQVLAQFLPQQLGPSFSSSMLGTGSHPSLKYKS